MYVDAHQNLIPVELCYWLFMNRQNFPEPFCRRIVICTNIIIKGDNSVF